MTEQAALWNGPGGDLWVDLAPTLDAFFAPVERLLVDEVARDEPGEVLDVGCGTGATTLALARRLGSATGVDVSAPMIDLARSRASDEGVAARFLVADAQDHDFAPATVDAVASRFGVMFFEDPVVAFANLRAATRPGGALRAIVWRSPAENPFMTTAQRAAAPVLTVPEPAPGAPGQFAFADPDLVQEILRDAGWDDAALDPVDVPCVLPEPELRRYLLRMGPLGKALRGADQGTHDRVAAVVRPAFDEFVHGDEVHVDLACWLVQARR